MCVTDCIREKEGRDGERERRKAKVVTKKYFGFYVFPAVFLS